MRLLATIVNLLLLAAFAYQVVKEGLEFDAENLPLVLLVVVAPTLSVIALLLRGAASKDWLSRYFARKALEERRKLERLQDARNASGASLRDGPAASPGSCGAMEKPPSVS